MKHHFNRAATVALLAGIVMQTSSPGQTAGITRMADRDKQHLLTKDVFRSVSRVKQLPQSVKDWFAQRATDPKSYLADAGQKYQEGCIVEKGLAPRRLILAGTADDHCFVHYEKGGRGRSYHVVVFRLSGDKAKLAWHGVARSKVTNLDQLRRNIAAGTLSDELDYGY